MDNSFDPDSSVVGGAGERHHAERIHSCPAGNCGYSDTAQHHSGTAFEVAGADDEQRLSCHIFIFCL